MRLDPAELKSDLAAHLVMLHEVRRRCAAFDVLHFHVDMIHFPMFEQHAGKTLTTLHGRLDLKDLWPAYERWPQFALASISNDQRRPMPHANWCATVPHGIPRVAYSFHEPAGAGYLAFLGRISPEKRPDVAIDVARQAGMPLKIAAKVDAADRSYFETLIRPLLAVPGVDFVGEIGDERKCEFLGNARALLFPIQWPEPFGLVMIEAMACGTPVIAWDCGSVREVVEHGVSGFIVRSVGEALAALEQISDLDRCEVRASFERRFTATTMARAYLDVYQQLGDGKLRRVS
jgi:glycosyltransferase involved in cell wall biosynthesis